MNLRWRLPYQQWYYSASEAYSKCRYINWSIIIIISAIRHFLHEISTANCCLYGGELHVTNDNVVGPICKLKSEDMRICELQTKFPPVLPVCVILNFRLPLACSDIIPSAIE